MTKALDFKNKEAYRKFLAYGHIHTKTGLVVKDKAGRKSLFKSTPGSKAITIAGKPHKVRHGSY